MGSAATGTALWKNQAEELARDFRVVVPDLRGAGESPKPPEPYSLQDFVDDLRGLVERLELVPAALVGHSFGGSIALEYAAQHPDGLSAVVAVGAPTELPEQNREGMRARADTVEREGMDAVAETVATNGTAPSFRERATRRVPGVRAAARQARIRPAMRRHAARLRTSTSATTSRGSQRRCCSSLETSTASRHRT